MTTVIRNPLPRFEAANSSEFLALYDTPLSSYCRSAVKLFGYLDNQGMALDDEDGGSGSIYIDQLYVFPKVSQNRIAPETLAQQESEPSAPSTDDQEEALMSVARVIADNPRLVLLGDPGVGKSTLVQWLVCSLCHWNENYGKKQLGPLFPLVLTARELKPTDVATELTNDTFIELILNTQGDQLATQVFNKPGAVDTLKQMLVTGQVLLLIDGLDEISPALSHWLSKQLRQLLTSTPKTRLLLTSRVVGFNPVDFWQIDVDEPQNKKHFADRHQLESIINEQAHLPANYYLTPFSPEQRQQFATNWVKNYLPPNDEKRQKFITDIGKIGQYSLQLNALSRIPVLLNLICFIQWRRGELPNGRAELYQRISETYLIAMDRARSIKNQLSNEYDYQDIKNWLGKLALQMQAGQLVISQTSLTDMDEDDLEDLQHQQPEITAERQLQLSETELDQFLQLQLAEAVDMGKLSMHSQQLIHYIKTRTGFLIPKGQIDGEEYYGFSHLSFLEYFAAYAIANSLQELDPKDKFTLDLFSTVDDPDWGEIWQLVFEELSLTGRSRRVIEQHLDRLFPFENMQRMQTLGWTDEAPESVVLYAKIIVNPAIKLAGNKRLSRQLALAASCLQSRCNQPSVINNLVENLFTHEPETLIQSVVNSTLLNLRPLALQDCSWLNRVTQLKQLWLNKTFINDLNVLENLTQLDILTIIEIKINNYQPLLALKNLQFLYADKAMDTAVKDQLEKNGVKVRLF